MLNSAGLLKYPEYAMDGVRVGSAILGRVSVRGNWGLARIGECQATIEELRWLPKGHSCGYGAGWTAKKPTRVAVFPWAGTTGSAWRWETICSVSATACAAFCGI